MAEKFRVLITDRAWPDCSIEREILAAAGAEVIEPASTDEGALRDAARDVDAIGACWAQVTGGVIRAAPRCRVVARFGIGLDNIDVATATRLRIPVTYVPDYCVEEVADHTLALLYAAARQVCFFQQRIRAGEYSLAAGAPRLRRLSGRTLGLIGFGRIGQRVYHKARAAGLRVIAHSRSGDDCGTGCPMASLPELLEQSDYISLHLPLTPQTERLIDAAAIARMPRGAVIINTSRGRLIDHAAVLAGLESGKLGGAALDVFDPEPPDLNDPLFRHEQVIATPHAGFYSHESVRELRTRAARQIADALHRRRPEHVVNPDVYEEPS